MSVLRCPSQCKDVWLLNKMDYFNRMFKCCCHGSLDNLSLASFTYGLRRYTKNALLIICQATSEVGTKSHNQALEDLAILEETFQKYLFESETYIDLTCSEIEDVLSKFFSRDFSDYGAIAVVILAQEGGPGTFMARDKMYNEDIIIKYLKCDETSPLSQKPKVYITEANRLGAKETNTQYSVPLDDAYRHVLGFHIPLIMEDGSRSPLKIFCDRMSNPHLEDYFTLIRIIDGAVREIEETFPQLQGKIEKTCTTIAAITLPSVEFCDH